MLVGNKSDDQERREVARETGAKLAAKWGTGFIETSAKNNNNITELFQQLLALEKKRSLALTMEDPDGKGPKRKACTIM
nr:Ras domain containing protein [Haemonchus contortus]